MNTFQMQNQFLCVQRKHSSIFFPAYKNGNRRMMHDVITDAAQKCSAQLALPSTSGDNKGCVHVFCDA